MFTHPTCIFTFCSFRYLGPVTTLDQEHTPRVFPFMEHPKLPQLTHASYFLCSCSKYSATRIKDAFCNHTEQTEKLLWNSDWRSPFKDIIKRNNIFVPDAVYFGRHVTAFLLTSKWRQQFCLKWQYLYSALMYLRKRLTSMGNLLIVASVLYYLVFMTLFVGRLS